MKGTAEKITDLRMRHGLTQQELADRLNVSRSLVAMWEAGTRTPDYFCVDGMARVFGVDRRELVDPAERAAGDSPEIDLIKTEISEIEAANGFPGTKTELLAAMKLFLSKQSTRDNALFMARYLFKKSYKEIAAELKLGPKTVSVRLSRLRKKLRKFLTEEKK